MSCLEILVWFFFTQTQCTYLQIQSIYFLSGPCFFCECNKSQNICFTNYYSSLIYTSSHSLLGLKYPMSVGKNSFTTKIIITAFKKQSEWIQWVQFMNIQHYKDIFENSKMKYKSLFFFILLFGTILKILWDIFIPNRLYWWVYVMGQK